MSSAFRVIPVIDIQSGIAVHARGGRRNAYRPVRSVLGEGHDPLTLALRFRDVLGLDELYVADLDAIKRTGENAAVLGRMASAGLRVWADAGLRESSDARALTATGVAIIVAATETLNGPATLREIAEAVGASAVVLSIDLRNGAPLLAARAGESATAAGVPDFLAGAIEAGVRRWLLLDVARVGLGLGTGTSETLAAWRLRYPDVAVFVGGGVSDLKDVVRLRDAGAAGVLVATALHEGTISRDDLDALNGLS